MSNQIFENNDINGTGTTCEGPRPVDVPQNSSEGPVLILRTLE